MNDNEIVAFFVMIGFATLGAILEGTFLGYFFGFVIMFTLGIIAFFGFLFLIGISGAIVDESYKIQHGFEHAVKNNNGHIDGARVKFGETEVYVEGPRNSFWKGLKYLTTGEEDYSTKIKICGKEVGKVKVSSDGSFKIIGAKKSWW